MPIFYYFYYQDPLKRKDNVLSQESTTIYVGFSLLGRVSFTYFEVHEVFIGTFAILSHDLGLLMDYYCYFVKSISKIFDLGVESQNSITNHMLALGHRLANIITDIDHYRITNLVRADFANIVNTVIVTDCVGQLHI